MNPSLSSSSCIIIVIVMKEKDNEINTKKKKRTNYCCSLSFSKYMARFPFHSLVFIDLSVDFIHLV